MLVPGPSSFLSPGMNVHMYPLMKSFCPSTSILTAGHKQISSHTTLERRVVRMVQLLQLPLPKHTGHHDWWDMRIYEMTFWHTANDCSALVSVSSQLFLSKFDVYLAFSFSSLLSLSFPKYLSSREGLTYFLLSTYFSSCKNLPWHLCLLICLKRKIKNKI